MIRRFLEGWRVEIRLTREWWLEPMVTVGAVLAGLALGGVVLLAMGATPWLIYAYLFDAAFGSLGAWSDTLVKATPLILTGLACIVAFRMRLWNIGAEGQLSLGAFGATLVVQELLPAETSRLLMLPTMLLVGMLCGGVWGALAGVLKARWQVNEIISTLMLNYVAIFWNDFFVYGPWSEGGFQLTPLFPPSAWLPRLSDYAADWPGLSGMTLHLGLALALLAAGLVWYLLSHTAWGYELKIIGDSPPAARYAGLNISRRTLSVLALSGALAGLAGVTEVAGVVHRLQDRISPGYGFTAILLAWLARLNPWALVPVSILFGGLLIGSRELQPSGVARMLQGIILFTLIGAELLTRVRLTRAPQAPGGEA